mmetsp:Transcript_170143/g.545627  ORF Transcript_170143/g.545627 Transcript_170143/m.545627 type:complete len:354 (+) Transcript_170143:83-1144(+)
MASSILGSICLLLLLASIPRVASTPCKLQYHPGRHFVELSAPSIGDRPRQWLLVVPEGLQPNAPAVMMLHGMGTTPYWADAMTDFSSQLRARRWTGLFPCGKAIDSSPGPAACCDHGCNASCCENPLTTGGSGNRTCGWDVTGHPGHGGDLGTSFDETFLRYLSSWATRAVCTDPHRIFLAGFSAGAMMANRMACESSDLFAAVGLQAGNLMTACENQSRAIPFLEVDGTADPTFGGLYRNAYSWAVRNGCKVAAVANSSDEQAARRSVETSSHLRFATNTSSCFELSGCAARRRYCTVTGLQHHWSGHVEPGCPGSSWCSPRGVLAGDVDTTREVLALFDASPAHDPVPIWV